MSDTAEIRRCLGKIAEHCEVEFANISLAVVWPIITRLVEATTFADADRRGDARERFTDDLVALLNQTRQCIRACDAVMEARDRQEAARKPQLRAIGRER